MRLMIILAVVGALLAIFFIWARVSGRGDAGGAGGVTSQLVTNDQATLVVRGWDQASLDRILRDVEHDYEMPAASLHSVPAGTDIYHVTFPAGIPADQLLYLVNYLHYPKSFDLKGRAPTAACVVILGPAFGVPDPTLNGRRATIYMPANDSEYDEAYIEVQSHGAWRVPFTNLSWIAAPDPRLPARTIELANSVAR